MCVLRDADRRAVVACKCALLDAQVGVEHVINALFESEAPVSAGQVDKRELVIKARRNTLGCSQRLHEVARHRTVFVYRRHVAITMAARTGHCRTGGQTIAQDMAAIEPVENRFALIGVRTTMHHLGFGSSGWPGAAVVIDVRVGGHTATMCCRELALLILEARRAVSVALAPASALHAVVL